MIILDLPDEIIRKILDFIKLPIKNYYFFINTCKHIKRLNYHMLFVPIKIFNYFICNYSYVINSKNQTDYIKEQFKINMSCPQYNFYEYIYDLKYIIELLFLYKINKKIDFDNKYYKKITIDKSPILLLHDAYKVI
jgi:hypothetical protein